MTTPRRDAGVDGLRGLLALAVVAVHWAGLLHPVYDFDSWYSEITLTAAYIAVAGFYVITGYVLPPLPYGRLVARRVRRLLPLHVAATLAGAAVLCAPWAIAWRETLFAYGLRPTINGPDWSLRVELLATILWPLITYAGRETAALVGLVGLSVLGARYWPDLIGLPFFALGVNLRAKGAVLPEYRLLMTDRVQLLGRISFSLYLTHWLVLSALGPWGALAVLPVAWAAYHLIEVPSLAWSRGRLTAHGLFTSFKSWRTKIGPAALRPAQSRRTP